MSMAVLTWAVGVAEILLALAMACAAWRVLEDGLEPWLGDIRGAA